MYEFVDPSIQCTYNGINCNNYLKDNGCFTGEVEFVYTVKNVGDTCHNIERVFTTMNLAGYRALAIDCESRLSCPDQEWQWTETRYIEPCQGNVAIAIDIETDAGNVDPSLGDVIVFAQPNLDSPVQAPTAVVTKPPVQAPTPAPIGLYPTVQADTSKTCTSRPNMMKFEFLPQICEYSINSQFIPYRKKRYLRHNNKDTASTKTNTVNTKDNKKENKKDNKTKDNKTKDEDNKVEDTSATDNGYECTGTSFPKNQKWYAIMVTSMDETIEYFTDENVCEGTEILIVDKGIISEELKIKVYGNGSLLQTVTMNASCACNEGEMSVGHSWGSFKLIDFREE